MDVVAPRNASFLHRWLAKARDQSAEDYRAGALVLQLAEQHPDEAQLLSHAAFYPRSASPQHLKVAYEADDCASEHESFSVYRHLLRQRTQPPAGQRLAHDGPRHPMQASLEVRRLEAHGGDAPSCPPAPMN